MDMRTQTGNRKLKRSHLNELPFQWAVMFEQPLGKWHSLSAAHWNYLFSQEYRNQLIFISTHAHTEWPQEIKMKLHSEWAAMLEQPSAKWYPLSAVHSNHVRLFPRISTHEHARSEWPHEIKKTLHLNERLWLGGHQLNGIHYQLSTRSTHQTWIHTFI